MFRINENKIDLKEPYHICRLLIPSSRYQKDNAKVRICGYFKHKKKLKATLRKKQFVGLHELPFDKFLFSMHKMQGETLTTTAQKGEEAKLKFVNPWSSLFELRQLVYLISQLCKAQNHKLYFCVQDKQMKELLGNLILQKFPTISYKVVLSNATRMHEALEHMQPTHAINGVVIFIGDMPNNIYEFFLKKNFLFLNSLSLIDTRACGIFDRYFLSFDGKNINSLIWFLAFVTKAYDRLKLGKFVSIKAEPSNMYEEVLARKLRLLPIGAYTKEERVWHKGDQQINKNFNNNPSRQIVPPKEVNMNRGLSNNMQNVVKPSYTSKKDIHLKQDHTMKHQNFKNNDKRGRANEKEYRNQSTFFQLKGNIEPKHEK